MPNQPFFSVIIPTYNRSSLISSTIRSVLDQEFDSFEIIVVDDGGTDNTEEIVKQFNSPKISYYKKLNEERGAARNFGWQKATGRYITFLDSDDFFYSYHLQSAFDSLTKLNYPFCLAQAYEIKDDKTGKIIWNSQVSNQSLINKTILFGNFLSCFGVFIKCEVFQEVRFEEERRFAGSEDWLLWLQLAARYPFFFNNKITGALMQHDNRSVHSFDEESLTFRPEFLRKKLQDDSFFLKSFGVKGVNRAYAHVMSYVALHFAINGSRRRAWFYLLKAVKANAGELMKKRSLATVKKILFT